MAKEHGMVIDPRTLFNFILLSFTSPLEYLIPLKRQKANEQCRRINFDIKISMKSIAD